MKMEIVIGNHRVPINPRTRSAPSALSFFCPMVAGVNKVNAVNLVLLAPSVGLMNYSG